MNTTPRKTAAVALVAFGIAAALSACSTSAAGPKDEAKSLNAVAGIGTVATVAHLADSVPADFRGRTLTVGTDATMPPKEFMSADGQTFEGFDVDLTYAIGNVLGIKMKFVNSGFDSLLPGVQNGRYDYVASSAAPTLEREKVVDFVSVDRSGESLLVKKESAGTIKDISSLCGRPAGAIKGSLQVQDLADQSAKCTAEGKKAIDTSLFPDASSLNLALSSGRVDAAFLDTPGSAYQAKQSNGKFVVVGPIYRAGLEGHFMKKGTGLADSVSDAVNALIKDGTYAKLLAKWGLDKSKISTSYVNPATSGKADQP
ncbi:ABC transporter substrate-binding protein [Leifsonia sp. 2TAF2]|uniref:ABC transporter substrate-binding protein n=1 Tax=Leifsonia sp. 2TAF2 TaxID=3233009 RepID=UPI003F9DF929